MTGAFVIGLLLPAPVPSGTQAAARFNGDPEGVTPHGYQVIQVPSEAPTWLGRFLPQDDTILMDASASRPCVALRNVHDARSISELIDQVCADDDSYEEGEDRPTAKAMDDLKRLLLEAAAIYDKAVPMGHISPYFGELSITWRNRDKMLRATSFSEAQSPRLDFGATPSPSLGTYQFDSDATGARLAERLLWLWGGQIPIEFS